MASSSSRAATSASTAGSDKERPRNSICRGHRPRRRDRKKICRRCPPEDLRKRVVLVVEDEPKLCKVAVKMLDRLGLQRMQAETAKDALEFLADRHVDVLFTDIELPAGMNGTELADAAQKLDPELKVLSTGYAREAVLHDEWSQKKFLGFSSPIRRPNSPAS